MPVSTADKRATFKKMHESGCFVLPNPFDVGSAKALQQLGLALARQHQAFESVEALGKRVDIGDVLGKGLDLRLGMKTLPIGKPQRHGEIVVENRDAQHDRQPPARMNRRVLL